MQRISTLLLRKGALSPVNNRACCPRANAWCMMRGQRNLTKLFVGGLSFRTTEEGLKNAFAVHGELWDAKIVLDRETGKSRGFGFVTFDKDEEADTAMAKMNGSMLDGRAIRVDRATVRAPSLDLGSSDPPSTPVPNPPFTPLFLSDDPPPPPPPPFTPLFLSGDIDNNKPPRDVATTSSQPPEPPCPPPSVAEPPPPPPPPPPPTNIDSDKRVENVETVASKASEPPCPPPKAPEPPCPPPKASEPPCPPPKAPEAPCPPPRAAEPPCPPPPKPSPPFTPLYLSGDLDKPSSLGSTDSSSVSLSRPRIRANPSFNLNTTVDQNTPRQTCFPFGPIPKIAEPKGPVFDFGLSHFPSEPPPTEPGVNPHGIFAISIPDDVPDYVPEEPPPKPSAIDLFPLRKLPPLDLPWDTPEADSWSDVGTDPPKFDDFKSPYYPFKSRFLKKEKELFWDPSNFDEDAKIPPEYLSTESEEEDISLLL